MWWLSCWLGALCLAGSWASSPRCGPSARCEPLGHGHDEHTFRVDGTFLYMKYADGDYFSIKCDGNLTLEHPALPRFDEELRVNTGVLRGCSPPAAGYSAALARLNVTVLQKLELSDVPADLPGDALRGRGRARALALVRVRLAPGLWRALPDLRRLRLEEARPPRPEELPPALEELHLVETGVRELSRAVLARLPALRVLTVRDEAGPLRVEAGAPLTELALQARAVTLPAALPPTLRRLTLDRWAERSPSPWESCDALVELELQGPALEAMPAGWVRACPALTTLAVRDAAALRALAPDALSGAGALTSLTLAGTALTELPASLLDDATNLTVLTLTGNRLRALPSGFLSLTRVTELYLGDNRLGPGAWAALAPLQGLRVLHLSHNPDLGDACGGAASTVRGSSQLVQLVGLVRLLLRRTGLSRVCRDWRDRMPHLQELDLRDNNITFLTYQDVQFGAGERAVLLDVSGCPVTRLVYSREERAAACTTRSRARVRLDRDLACDCGALWAARALRECPHHVRVEGARCGPRRPLREEPLADLTCPLGRAECGAPDGCSCARREDERGEVWRVRCAGAGLAAPPALRPRPARPALAVRWELVLPHNNLSELHATHLPAPLQELDVRYNSLSHVSSEVLDALAPGARLLLAHNALSCECEAARHVRALLARPDLRTDGPRCGGAPLAVPARCASPAAPPAAPPASPLALLAPLVAVALLVALLAAHPPARHRLERAVREALCPPARVAAAEGREAPAEAALPYDVFLSFSHEDSSVAERLLSWLEARRYRVCVHWRDWAPGGWIPAQIAASVRRSRRTVALVSRGFLRSGWARAEFREAWAGPGGARAGPGRARLVAVLLEEPRLLPLDAELRHYLSHNTYVLWDDAHLWDKLSAALPPPATPPPAAPPAAAAPPPAH